MKLARVVALLVGFIFTALSARADVTVLLEEPYSYDGALAGAGHTAVYLTRVCAASPTRLRQCEPGEPGVVISRYTRIAGYDWIAIPLIPYLYAVDGTEDIPLYADSKLAAFLRDRYRREHLEDIAPDKPSGETPGGDWVQLIGSSYDRTSYGFQIETTEAQDDRFIEWMNARPNAKSYQVVARNCADFVKDVVNFYYPKAISESIVSDFGVATPKHAAKSLVKYSQRHADLEFARFVIPQVPGGMKRSKPVRGLVESVFKAKKYEIPLAVLNPFVAGGFASAYLVGGRFNPSKNDLVFSPYGKPEPPLSAEERRIYKKNMDDLLQGSSKTPLAGEGLTLRQFLRQAQPGLDLSGRAILRANIGDETVELGVSRGNLSYGKTSIELQREFLATRVRADLAVSRFPVTSKTLIQEDWNLLQSAMAAEPENFTAQANAPIRETQRPPHSSHWYVPRL